MVDVSAGSAATRDERGKILNVSIHHHHHHHHVSLLSLSLSLTYSLPSFTPGTSHSSAMTSFACRLETRRLSQHARTTTQ